MSGIVHFSPGVRRNMFRTYVFRGMDGTPRVFRGSPKREGRAFSVHDAAGRPVQEDEHLLPLMSSSLKQKGAVKRLASFVGGLNLVHSKVSAGFLAFFLGY